MLRDSEANAPPDPSESAEPVPTDSPRQTPDSPTDSGEVTAPSGFLPVLRNRNFLVLWSGQVFSNWRTRSIWC
jgi:hypothetical protein